MTFGSGGPAIIDPLYAQTWTTDSAGNLLTLTTIPTSAGAGTIAQRRTYNAQNQIRSIVNTQAPPNIPGPTLPTYDARGNMTADENQTILHYDGWNRLVRTDSRNASSAISYDALGRRITEETTQYVNGNPSSVVTRELYLDLESRVVEEGAPNQVSAEYVWSPLGGNLLSERDEPQRRFYVLQDPLGSVTSLYIRAGGDSVLVERFVYDAFGTLSVLTRASPATLGE